VIAYVCGLFLPVQPGSRASLPPAARAWDIAASAAREERAARRCLAAAAWTTVLARGVPPSPGVPMPICGPVLSCAMRGGGPGMHAWALGGYPLRGGGGAEAQRTAASSNAEDSTEEEEESGQDTGDSLTQGVDAVSPGEGADAEEGLPSLSSDFSGEDSTTPADEGADSLDEDFSFHTSSEALPEQVPANWTATATLSHRKALEKDHKASQEQVSHVMHFAASCALQEPLDVSATQRGNIAGDADPVSKWFDSAEDDADGAPSASQAGVQTQRPAKSGTRDRGVVVVPPARGVAIRPLVIPNKTAAAARRPGGRSSSQTRGGEARTSVRTLLKRSRRSVGAGPLDSSDADDGQPSSTGAAGGVAAGASGARRGSQEKRAPAASPLDEIIRARFTLDALVARAAAGDMAAAAAAGIRMLFNGEQPSRPVVELTKGSGGGGDGGGGGGGGGLEDKEDPDRMYGEGDEELASLRQPGEGMAGHESVGLPSELGQGADGLLLEEDDDAFDDDNLRQVAWLR